MRNYSKIYLEINERLDPEVRSMEEMKCIDKIDEKDYRGYIYYIPRDGKMNGL